MLEQFRNGRILLIVAHPDDEILGPGATMHRLITEFGARVRVVILGEGITSRSAEREPARWERELAEHRANIESARKWIGFEETRTYDFADNRFDGIDLLDIVKVVEREVAEFLPLAIFTHHGGDLNIDHQRTFEAVMTACRPMQDQVVRQIVTFPTASGTEWRASTDPRHFIPNLFVRVSESNIEAKISAMESYVYERRAFPHPRSPEALRIFAAHSGMIVGAPLAECFAIVRVVC
ncbi:LmbE family N-acetylglucosaminyl deacetylase [Lewinella aquimaris]|uniref:LmbE family N-acetylglucosaminyl deacetylase n=1 Tax=Neolewinella aquimaris TaxID=1835722 RepID=A0A840E9H4_9BACT|nr:PIG-L family deacetylase [Neolewinella aquimaris]MBB4080205.1 LmbE family N-acetylglucosaminyl deacetylase [Neolewinella aquimaris]